VLTGPIPAGRSRIRIDAVARPNGRVRVAIVDGSGAAHPGLGLGDFLNLPADARRTMGRWADADAVVVPPGSRVLVELQDATLYGIESEPAEETFP
jgi:hypothetical protein